MRHVEQPGAGGHSPSDFALVSLSQGEVEDLERRYPRLEDVLPLSPLQQGLLFHARCTTRRDRTCTRCSCDRAGPGEGGCGADALRAVEGALRARHGNRRRPIFYHEALAEPVQVIGRRVRRCRGGKLPALRGQTRR